MALVVTLIKLLCKCAWLIFMAHKVNTLNCQLTIGKNALDAAFGAFDINDCALIKKKT